MSVTLKNRANLVIGLLALLITAGTIGFHTIEGWDWFQSFYATLMTISTIGARPEDQLSRQGQMFNVILIFSGLVVIGFAVGSFTQAVIEFELTSFFGRRRMEREISKLQGHFIICGAGRVGRRIALEMSSRNLPFLIIEKEAPRAQWAQQHNFPVILGDASSEEILGLARIEHARGLASAVTSDAQNVYIVLTARSLAPHLPIAARASEEDAESKLLKAGANFVISPYSFAGQRMARTLTQPRVQRFIDTAFSSVNEGGLDLQIEELVISDKCPMANRKLASADLRRRFGVIVLAIRRADGRVDFNPGPEDSAASGDSIIAMGESHELKGFEDFLSPGTR